MLYNNGLRCTGVYRISYGRPNIVDLIREGKIKWIVNTPEAGPVAMTDEVRMRSEAIAAGIPITTTLNGNPRAASAVSDD